VGACRADGPGPPRRPRAGSSTATFKPSNIMVTQSEEPVILDFGSLGSGLEATSAFRSPGSSSGTPAYMSPESNRGGRIRWTEGRTSIPWE